MLDVQPLTWTADGWPVFTNRWSADYAFENDARDDLSGFNGTLVGGPRFKQMRSAATSSVCPAPINT